MRRRTLTALAGAVSLGAALATVTLRLQAAGESFDHRVAIHVDENDPARMKLVLNNVANVQKYYDDQGESVQIEVVAYGPGLHMLRADTSPVKDRIATLSLEVPDLRFSACGNTHDRMIEQAGGPIELIEEARMVRSGVVQLIELQERGYAYVRP